jgi:hypothetical protein
MGKSRWVADQQAYHAGTPQAATLVVSDFDDTLFHTGHYGDYVNRCTSSDGDVISPVLALAPSRLRQADNNAARAVRDMHAQGVTALVSAGSWQWLQCVLALCPEFRTSLIDCKVPLISTYDFRHGAHPGSFAGKDIPMTSLVGDMLRRTSWAEHAGRSGFADLNVVTFGDTWHDHTGMLEALRKKQVACEDRHVSSHVAHIWPQNILPDDGDFDACVGTYGSVLRDQLDWMPFYTEQPEPGSDPRENRRALTRSRSHTRMMPYAR